MPRDFSRPTLRRGSIDLGLDVIETVREPGQSLSCGEIADVCGCSPQAIQQIYQRALRKLRDRAQELQQTANR